MPAASILRNASLLTLKEERQHNPIIGRCLSHDDRLDAFAGALAHLISSMGMDQTKAAAEQKQGEAEAIVEAFTDAMEGGPSVFKGRMLRVDGIDGMPEDWTDIWD